MSEFGFLGGGAGQVPGTEHLRHEQQVARLALHRVLEFLGFSIDDVLNDAIVRNQVLGYYRLCRFVERRCDEIEHERRGQSVGQVKL
jgi:hypothetical protein